MFDEITVGQVSSLIALGVLIVQITFPLAVIIVLVGLIADENTTVTWSVVGRLLQNTWWPTILQADSVATRGVRFVPIVVSWLVLLGTLILSVASLVTPLGLMDSIGQGNIERVPFRYTPDNSSFGRGTPRRSDLPPSRLCTSGKLESIIAYYACPGVPPGTVSSRYFGGDISNTDIPQNVTDLFSSATSEHGTSLSGIFDIQARQYVTRTISAVNEGKPYLEASYRPLDKLLLDDRIGLVEGLIVDTKSGGIGFRNHSVPDVHPGATWSEDILWMRPVTQCVDTNVSLHFTVDNKNGSARDVLFRDDGGLSNQLSEPEPYSINNATSDPNLFSRAYTAAWTLNAITALVFNYTTAEKFPRVPAGVPGRNFTIELYADEYGYRADSIGFSTFSAARWHLLPDDVLSTAGLSYNVSDLAENCQRFDDIGEDNVNSPLVRCYVFYGAPRRSDGSPSLIAQPGELWEQSIFTCASSTQVSVKEVVFRANGTSSLSSSAVIEVKDKPLADLSPKPLWGIENTQTQESLYAKPLWGLIDQKFANHQTLWSFQEDSLFLPAIDPDLDMNNVDDSLAGTTIPSAMWTSLLYGWDDSSNSLVDLAGDYSGRTNFAMLNLWQNLSQDASTVHRIINLIYTDLLSSALIGTKSRLDPSPDPAASSGTNEFEVTLYVRRIQYQLAYAIPAMIILTLWLGILLFASGSMLFSRFSFRRLRGLVNHTSAGRILTAGNMSEFGWPEQRTSEWVEQRGGALVTYVDPGSVLAEESKISKVAPEAPLLGR